ncbi:MAG: murein hydrolase activator EnvC family protein [Acidobacteriota bacterium]
MDNYKSSKYFSSFFHFRDILPGQYISSIFLVSIVSFSLTLPLRAQEKITDKKAELKELKQEINRLEDELKKKSKKERISIEMLENYSRQNHYLNQLINSIRSEEEEKDKQIGKTENEATAIEKEIGRLKSVYAKYIVHLYKHGKDSELNSVFSSGSFNKALVRYKYLKRISLQRQKNIAELKEKQDELSILQKKLVAERDEKRAIAEEKQKEEKNLDVKLLERKSILAGLRNDKNSLYKELELKKKAEGEIRNLISRLIEKEERRKAEERKAAEEKRKQLLARLEKAKKNKENKEAATRVENKSLTGAKEEAKEELAAENEIPSEDYTYSGMESFSSLRGRLHWPVNSGKVIRKFGENRNSKLNTVTLNYGIDIKALDTGVKAVCDGIVSAVNWVPGYGSVLIITHKNGFRTVYGHLGEILVGEGARVKSGAVIGRISESLEGSILHFEIWNERSNQNPEVWLGRR